MADEKLSALSAITTLADNDLLYIATAGGTSARITVADARRAFAQLDYFTISGNITLDASHNGRTGYITADAVITLPVYADEDPGYTVELMDNGQADHTVTLATQSTDTVRKSETVVGGDAVISRSPTAGQWAATGEVSAP